MGPSKEIGRECWRFWLVNSFNNLIMFSFLRIRQLMRKDFIALLYTWGIHGESNAGLGSRPNLLCHRARHWAPSFDPTKPTLFGRRNSRVRVLINISKAKIQQDDN